MAQIFAFGRVENDLVPKKSQKDSTYVCFGFTEQTGKGQFQYYQVWAWDDEVSRLARLGVKKGSRLWITGTQHLVDCTTVATVNPEDLSIQFRISSGRHFQRRLHRFSR